MVLIILKSYNIFNGHELFYPWNNMKYLYLISTVLIFLMFYFYYENGLKYSLSVSLIPMFIYLVVYFDKR